MLRVPSNGRVAVLILVRDAALLPDTLDSVFFQSRPPDEVIIIEDAGGNTADVRRVVAPYARRAFVVSHAPGDTPAACDAALAATDADFVAVLRSGDRWLPHFLRTQLDVLRRNADVHVSFSNGMFTGDPALAGLALIAPALGRVTLERLLGHMGALPCSAAVIRRAMLTEAGGLAPAPRRLVDFDLWARIAARGGQMHVMPQVLMLRRVDTASHAAGQLEELEAAADTVQRLRDQAARDGERRSIEERLRQLRAEMTYERARTLLEEGDVRGACAAFSAVTTGRCRWKARMMAAAARVAPSFMRRVCAAGAIPRVWFET